MQQTVDKYIAAITAVGIFMKRMAEDHKYDTYDLQIGYEKKKVAVGCLLLHVRLSIIISVKQMPEIRLVVSVFSKMTVLAAIYSGLSDMTARTLSTLQL